MFVFDIHNCNNTKLSVESWTGNNTFPRPLKASWGSRCGWERGVYSVTRFRFQGHQDVWSGDCRVRRLSNTEQSRDGIGLQLPAPGWRPGYLLKLALLEVILGESTKIKTQTRMNRSQFGILLITLTSLQGLAPLYIAGLKQRKGYCYSYSGFRSYAWE